MQGRGRSRAIAKKNIGEKITKYVGYNKLRVAEQKQVGGTAFVFVHAVIRGWE